MSPTRLHSEGLDKSARGRHGETLPCTRGAVRTTPLSVQTTTGQGGIGLAGFLASVGPFVTAVAQKFAHGNRRETLPFHYPWSATITGEGFKLRLRGISCHRVREVELPLPS